MITDEQKNKLLEELEKHSIIGIACRNAGISRSSFYRLMSSSRRFEKQAKTARQIGIHSNNDSAESVIIKGIRENKTDCAKYYLEHNHPTYKKKDRSNEHIIRAEDSGLAGMMKRLLKKQRKEKRKANNSK